MMRYLRWKVDTFILFIKCLLTYKESIRGNELTIVQCWGLCDAVRSMRYYPSIPFKPEIRIKGED